MVELAQYQFHRLSPNKILRTRSNKSPKMRRQSLSQKTQDQSFIRLWTGSTTKTKYSNTSVICKHLDGSSSETAKSSYKTNNCWFPQDYRNRNARWIKPWRKNEKRQLIKVAYSTRSWLCGNGIWLSNGRKQLSRKSERSKRTRRGSTNIRQY